MSLFVWSQILAAISMILSVTAVQMRSGRIMRIVMFIASVFRGTHFFFLGSPQAGWITYITGTR